MLEAAFRRGGVLRVDNISELFYMAEVLGQAAAPQGPRLTMVTNAGGPGVLATDALIDQRRRDGRGFQGHDGGAEQNPAARTGATTIRSTCWATPSAERLCEDA